MRRIIQANIDQFKELLKIETGPAKRTMESRVLPEEEAKLKQAQDSPRRSNRWGIGASAVRGEPDARLPRPIQPSLRRPSKEPPWRWALLPAIIPPRTDEAIE
jgi:hypothetical protein